MCIIAATTLLQAFLMANEGCYCTSIFSICFMSMSTQPTQAWFLPKGYRTDSESGPTLLFSCLKACNISLEFS